VTTRTDVSAGGVGWERAVHVHRGVHTGTGSGSSV
jgi:hypothetical protein